MYIPIKEISRNSWVIIKPTDESKHRVKWSPEFGGVVKTKLNCFTNWEYSPCIDIKFARSVSSKIIKKQKKDRNIALNNYDFYVKGL